MSAATSLLGKRPRDTQNKHRARPRLGDVLPMKTPGRLCRIPGCTNNYRTPDFVCGDHGGGKCHYRWQDISYEGCSKFHQGKNASGEYLCGRHSNGVPYGKSLRDLEKEQLTAQAFRLEEERRKRIAKELQRRSAEEQRRLEKRQQLAAARRAQIEALWGQEQKFLVHAPT